MFRPFWRGFPYHITTKFGGDQPADAPVTKWNDVQIPHIPPLPGGTRLKETKHSTMRKKMT